MPVAASILSAFRRPGVRSPVRIMLTIDGVQPMILAASRWVSRDRSTHAASRCLPSTMR